MRSRGLVRDSDASSADMRVVGSSLFPRCLEEGRWPDETESHAELGYLAFAGKKGLAGKKGGKRSLGGKGGKESLGGKGGLGGKGSGKSLGGKGRLGGKGNLGGKQGLGGNADLGREQRMPEGPGIAACWDMSDHGVLVTTFARVAPARQTPAGADSSAAVGRAVGRAPEGAPGVGEAPAGDLPRGEVRRAVQTQRARGSAL